MGYWDGVKRRFKAMVDGEMPTEEPRPAPPPPAEQASAPPRVAQPDMIRRKFQEWHGREPFSDKELMDWWDSIG